MPVYAYVNGQYLPHSAASVHIEDRGFQFADSVYEVISCINGTLADERGHMDRLERSLKELQMPMPVNPKAFGIIMRHLLRKNRLKNAAIYIQVSRGAARRDFKFPDESTPQSVVITSWPFDFKNNPYIKKGAKAVTTTDIRWARRDIKTTGLLAQSLAKQEGAQKGAQETIMLDDEGYITEGSSSNSWIIKDKTLYTRKADHHILKGITRMAVFHVADKLDLKIVEKKFTPTDLQAADEAFQTSATSLIMPVVELDGKKVGNGKPGPIAQKIHKEYMSYVNGLSGPQLPWRYEE